MAQQAVVVGQEQRRRPARRKPTGVNKGRPSDGTEIPEVVDADPEMKYQLVFQGLGTAAVRRMEQRGWQIVYFDKDGPRLNVGDSEKAGDPVEFNGHVLMDIPLEDWKDLQAAGQKELDRIETRIVDKENGPYDAARGMSNRYGRVVNETGRNQIVRERAPEQEEAHG